MKLFVFALLAVGIGFSCATTQLPPGCGVAFVQSARAAKSRLNDAGKNGVDQLEEGIKQLRRLIAMDDVVGQAANLRDPGAVGMRKLATTTTDSCLQRIFLVIANKDEQVARQITGCDPRASANLVCNLLNYKANLIQQCLRIPVCD